MDLDKRYATDPALEEEGVRIPFGDGAWVQVRSNESEFVKAVRKKVLAPYALMMRGGRPLPEAVQEDVLVKVLARGIVVTWGGIKVKGDVVPFTVENAERIFKDRTMRGFRDDVGLASQSLDSFKREALEDDAKN